MQFLIQNFLQTCQRKLLLMLYQKIFQKNMDFADTVFKELLMNMLQRKQLKNYPPKADVVLLVPTFSYQVYGCYVRPGRGAEIAERAAA